MNCTSFETLLSDYVDRTLPRPAREAVEAHLTDCPNCRHLRDRVVSLRRELQSFPEVAPPPDLSDRILSKTTGVPSSQSWWERFVAPVLHPFFTKRFTFATALLFVFLSLMVNVVGPPVGAALSPAGLAESADRLTTKVSMRWAQVLSLVDMVTSEAKLMTENLYGRLDYHLITQLLRSYQTSIQEEKKESDSDAHRVDQEKGKKNE